MFRLNSAWTALTIVFVLGMTAPASRAADVDVKKKGGVPVEATVKLSHLEAQAMGAGKSLDIPGLPSMFEKPFRKLGAKIKATDKGKGVTVTLTVRAFPPGIKDRVEAR